MKKVFCIFFLSLLCLGIVLADGRPLADGIEAYSVKYSIEPHIPEMLKSIKAVSMEYNGQGYVLYEQNRYKEAVSRFQQAISADSGNTFAKYNMACSYALMGGEYSAKVAGILASVANENRGWGDQAYWNYWGVQMMVDPDLDSVRSFDTGGANYLNFHGLSEYLLLSGGKALIQISSENIRGPVTEGYFCVIGEYVFMFFDVPTTEHVVSERDYRIIWGSVVWQAVPVSKLSFKEVSMVKFYEEYERKHK
ncbi:MAG: hypothetical protein E4H36_07680 [Spirochaetales bacterium]|nr:MAG: hypothetical protein E4H36_07680 [Spirochaetales bacterium]